jgi:tripartite-type tricarboxylate transporter receptor subunit TctC
MEVMNTDRRVFAELALSCVVIGAVVSHWPASASADEWPSRAVTVLVPFSAGGITDTMARIMSSYLSVKFGQPFVVDNRDGASGAIAAEAVAHANPDGYTLLLGATPQISIVPYMQHVNYDPKKDLVPTSIFGTDPFVMMVRSDLPVKTTQEFIDYAKARPGQLTFASGGNATISRLSASLFLARAGLDLVHVPYRGGAPAMVDMLGHHVDMYFGSAVDVAPIQGDQRVRLLAVTSGKASPLFPDLPPIADVLPGYSLTTWNGLMAPAGTPQAIIDKITQGIIEAAHDPAIGVKLKNANVEPVGSTTAEFQKTINDEQAALGEAIKAIGTGN